MNLTPNQAIKVAQANKTYQLPILGSQSSFVKEIQKSQEINQTEQKLEGHPQTDGLQLCFQNLACVGQICSAIIAVTLAIELASGLTAAMVILGIVWMGYDRFWQVDS